MTSCVMRSWAAHLAVGWSGDDDDDDGDDDDDDHDDDDDDDDDEDRSSPAHCPILRETPSPTS